MFASHGACLFVLCFRLMRHTILFNVGIRGCLWHCSMMTAFFCTDSFIIKVPESVILSNIIQVLIYSIHCNTLNKTILYKQYLLHTSFYNICLHIQVIILFCSVIFLVQLLYNNVFINLFNCLKSKNFI